MNKHIGREIDAKKFGKELNELIKSKGYKSLYDFHLRSAQICISYSSLKAAVAGSVKVSFTNLVNLADALEISHSEFFAHFSYTYIKK